MTGHALEVGTYPIADYTAGGWLGGLIAANKTLLALANADTRIVPGVGPVQTRADLQAQLDMLAEMLARFTKMMKQGMGPDDIARRGADEGVRREVGKSGPVRVHRVSRHVAARSRAGRHRVDGWWLKLESPTTTQGSRQAAESDWAAPIRARTERR